MADRYQIPTSGYFPFLELGSITLPVYHLTISTVLCLIIFWTYRRGKKTGQDLRILLDLMLLVVLSGFLGARLAHVIIENPTYYLQSWQDSVRILQVWNGGFVWYGGVILSAAASYLFLKRKNEVWLQWSDFMAPSLAFGYGLGRLACFFTGCCHGGYCQLTDHTEIQYPTQLFATLWDCGIGLLLLRFKPNQVPPYGGLFFLWLGLHSLGRLIMESFRSDPRGSPIFGLTPSAFMSLILIMLAIPFFVKLVKGKKRPWRSQ